MRDSTIFYRSFYEAISELDPTTKAKIYDAIFEYSLNFKIVELEGVAKTVFTLIKPQIDANIKRYINGTQPKDKQDKSEPKAKGKRNKSKTEANANENNNDNLNENNNDEVFNFKTSLLKLCDNKKVVDDWLLVRKNKKATNSETAFNLFKAEVERAKMSWESVLLKCIEKNWIGFKIEWLNNSQLNNNQQEDKTKYVTD